MPFMPSRAQRELKALTEGRPCIEFNAEGTVLSASPEFLALMGYALNEVRGQHHSLFVDPAHAASADYRAFWQALRDGQMQSAEFARITKGGQTVWLHATYNPVRNAWGKVVRVVKVAQDTTAERRQTLDAQARLGAISKAQAIIEFDPQGRVLAANDNFLQCMGYRLDEVVGQHHRMFMNPQEASSDAYNRFWQALRQGRYQATEFKRRHKSGQDVWLQASYNPIIDIDGSVSRIVKFATDITQQVAMRKTAEVLSLVADGTDNSVVITNAAGRIEYINAGFSKLTGYSEAEAMGHKPGELLQGQHTDAGTVARIRDALHAQQPFYEEILNYSKAGAPYWISLSINPILDAAGQLVRYVSVQANVAQTRMRAQEDATRLDAIRASNATVDWSADGRPLDASPTLLQLLG